MTRLHTAPRVFPHLAILLAGMFVLGCGSSEHSDLGQIEGTVTLDGAPYPNAMVTFTPAKGRPSRGVTDEQGHYELIYLRDTRGAEIGDHKVLITTVPPITSDSEPGPPPKEVIPARYNRRSELTETVEPGNQEIDFALTTR